ncbi:Protein E6-like protein [Melia azedarach]|uniref:Protein E6-like protein n=1 Tax=Melia azedarach TaxID=155640 RepID=A0ACC1Z2Q3_MELAZ|nr:Protein E6-like protein [Melia azedarach]
MAFLVKSLSFFFLILIISSLQIQARESKFFNKFTHITTNEKVIPESQISQAPTSAPELAPMPAEAVPTIAAEPTTAPAVAPIEPPASFYAESENGYGLYGHGSGQFPPAKETVPSTTSENDLFNERLSAESYKTGYQNGNYKSTVYNNNNGYNSNYNTNGYVTEKQGMSDTRFMQNYQNSYYSNEYTNGNKYSKNEYTNGNNYKNVYPSNYNNVYTSYTGYTGNNNNGYTSNYNTNSYETEKKGISDTRFLENGKYYYDVKNENNYFPNGFESERGTPTNEGYYGNTQDVNEFNTMEDFEDEQEYKESPEKYVP